MKTFVSMIAASVVALSGCGRGLDCVEISKPVTGDLAEDAVGTWGAFGIDSFVVRELRQDGEARTVEEPNQYSPSGLISSETWAAEDGVLTIGTTAHPDAAVTATHLDLGDGRSHPRLECSGFGFD